MWKSLASVVVFAWSIVATSAAENHSNKIDVIIANSLKRQRQEMPKPISDETFIRRAYIDIAGRIPTYDEGQSFTNRKELINKLLDSRGYTENMFNFWADLLRLKKRLSNNVNGANYIFWVKDQIADNVSYDVMVKRLLTSSGSIWENPQVGYFLRDEGMLLDNVSNTFQAFAGMDISCAQCHDHPFDDWTQFDYYNLTAFFGQIDTRNRNNNNGELKRIRDEATKMDKGEGRGTINKVNQFIRYGYQYNVEDNDKKFLKLPHDYQYRDGKPNEKVRAMTVMGKHVREHKNRDGLRNDFAEWLTADTHPFFAANIVNRLWDRAFGFPLIDGLNDITTSDKLRKSKNDELLRYLTTVIKKVNYDTKQFNRILFNTRFYQSQADAEGKFRGPALRRMTAAQFWDSLVTLQVGDPDQWQPPRYEEEYLKVFSDISQINAPDAVKKLNEYNSLNKKYYSNAPKLGSLLAVRSSHIFDNSKNTNFLIEFGRSDRELIQKGDQDGNITQILVLMNSPLASTLGSKISFAMKKAQSAPKEKSLEILFYSFLGRMPSAEEKKALGEADLYDVVWVLLNSHEMKLIT